MVNSYCHQCKHCMSWFDSDHAITEHLLNIVKIDKIIEIRMAKALMELDAVAYCPPSGETQMMILKAKLILKDTENKSDGE